MRTAVLAYGNTSQLSDSAKHILNLVALFKKFFVIRDGRFLCFSGKDRRADALFAEICGINQHTLAQQLIP